MHASQIQLAFQKIFILSFLEILFLQFITNMHSIKLIVEDNVLKCLKRFVYMGILKITRLLMQEIGTNIPGSTPKLKRSGDALDTF